MRMMWGVFADKCRVRGRVGGGVGAKGSCVGGSAIGDGE